MKKTNIPKRAKIVVRPSHPAVKVMAVLVLLFSTAALVALWWVHGAITAETEKLRGDASAVEYANSELEQRINDPDSVENVRKIAEDELGLVDPDTVVIQPES